MFQSRQKCFDVESFEHISSDSIFERTDNTQIRSRYRRFLANAIRYLPPKQQVVVMMYFLDELTMAEIAKRLDVNKSTVSRRLAAAQATLRSLARLCEKSGLFPS